MKKIVLIVGGLAAVAVAVFAGLVATNTIVLFKHGFVFSGAEEARLEVQGDEFQKLDQLQSLKSIVFVGDTDYDQAQQWSCDHADVKTEFDAAPSTSASADDQPGTVDLTKYGEQEAIDMAASRLRYDEDVKAMKVNAATWSAESLNALHEACPNAAIVGTYNAGSRQVSLDAKEIDLSDASLDDLNAFADVAPCMVNLESVIVGQEQGHTKLPAVGRIKQGRQDANVDYKFTAYGMWVDVNTTSLDFRQVPVNDNGDEVRELLTSMPYVTYLDMDSTGVDNEHMAKIRDDFPNVNVVWRVWFGPNDVYTCRTDVTKILASAEVFGWITPENSQPLIYCTKVKNLDLGHNGGLADIYFINYMPDLEVFICSLGGVSDISPVANCPHMEYFECFGNNITDLSPLSELHELRHLNVVNNLGISDITCLYGLDLERFWLGGLTQVPQEQIDEFMALHPNCVVRTVLSNPHEDYRWGNPRYDLLNETMGYTTQDYQIASRDPLLEPRTDIPWADGPAPQATATASPADDAAHEDQATEDPAPEAAPQTTEVPAPEAAPQADDEVQVYDGSEFADVYAEQTEEDV